MNTFALVLAATVLRVHYPAADRSLTLRGSEPLSWGADTPLAEVAPDVYEARFDDDRAPREVKPMLAGRWSIGENVVLRRGATTEVWPRFSSERGRVVALPSTRRVWVYLPPSYDEHPTRRYPVWYAQDGQNVFEATRGTGSAVTWRVDRALDERVRRDPTASEAIVVAAEHGGQRRIFEYTPTSGGGAGGGAPAYLDWVVTELKPKVDATYRTQPGPSATAVFGSSLGGLFATFATTARPDVFGVAAAFSPSTWWDGRVITRHVRALAGARVRPERIYVDCGATRDGRADTDVLASAWQDVGYSAADLTYVVDSVGRHDEASWARRFPAAFDALSGAGPNAP